MTKELKEQIDAVPGTESSDIVGAPQEEIVISVRPEAAIAMDLSAQAISRQIQLSDTKVSAGRVYGQVSDLLLEVSGELDSTTQLSHIPIQVNTAGVVELGDVATIERSIQTPLDAKVVLHDLDSVALCVFAQASYRLDRWMAQVRPIVDDFSTKLPPGISLEVVFQQQDYVAARMHNLWSNLFYGVIAVFVVVLVIMGPRSALIISLSLPLGCMTVMFVMYACEIPIHQISITGLIISLGLMIDNAIVAVDEVDKHLRFGATRIESVSKSVSFLAVPLLASTLTTVLSFGPIALMPGPSGEFVGSIATVTIAAVSSSLFLSLTVVASIAAIMLPSRRTAAASNEDLPAPSSGPSWISSLLAGCYRFPKTVILLMSVGPLLGLACFPFLQEQFFPPADRAQFQIEMELPGTGSLLTTERLAKQVRDTLLDYPEIRNVAWFLGESAPPFYYNVIPDRKRSARFGQAIVDCVPQARMCELIRAVQKRLDRDFPGVTCLVRQLEQGPPFAAPIEAQLFGSDPDKLRELGDHIRLVMASTPDIVLTRSDLSESIPKVTFTVDECQARLAGLDHSQIADALSALLDGVTGGSILEETEELPVRVRISNAQRGDLSRIASLDLIALHAEPSIPRELSSYQGVPLSALAQLDLEPSG